MDRDEPAAGPDILVHGAGGEDRPARRWPWWLALALAVVVAVIFLVRAERRDPAPPPVARPTTAAPASIAPATSVPSAGSAPVTTELGHPVLGGGTGWELFARGGGVVVRIEPGRGRVTVTSVPGLASGGPVAFLAGPDRVIIRPLDRVPGYEVPDGGPARALTGALAQDGPVLPGPDAKTVWLAEPKQVSLIGIDGRPRDVAVSLPPGMESEPVPDGSGYPLFSAPGGAYSVRPDGIRRLTTGNVLATGPTRLLVWECDDRYRCAAVLVDRRSGARHRLSIRLPANVQIGGTISADGNRAAVMVAQPPLESAVHVLDLRAGADRPIDPPVAQRIGGQFAWSPDGRWLLLVGSDGRLYRIDAVSGSSAPLGFELPYLEQLAIRG